MVKMIETQKGRFLIRVYQPEDKEGILSLWKAAFGKEMPPRLWRWKYLENPYDRQIVLCVSEAGVPVAMYSGIPYRANWLGETVRFTHLIDNVSHPAYRGALGGRTGLFVRTANAFFDRYGGPHASVFMYGFPGKRHYLLGEKLLKYKAVPDGVSFLSASTTDLQRKLAPFLGRIDPIRRIDDSIDRLAQECRSYYPFALLRDAGFLRWRFFEHPAREYEIWGYRTYLKKDLKGYCVFSREGKTVRLIDMLAPPSSRMICDFLARIGAEFAKREIDIVETWFPARHFLTKAAISGGFTPLPEPLGIIPTGLVFLSSLSFDWASQNIYYSMADGDLF
jgi:hypothetical protein